MPQVRPAVQQIAHRTNFPLATTASIAARLKNATDGALWPRSARATNAAQVRPDHLVALTLGVGLAGCNPKSAPELVGSFWNMGRRTLTLIPESSVTTDQIDALESEAAAIFLPVFGTTLAGLVEQFAGAMPDELRAHIGATLEVELKLGEVQAAVTFVEPGIGTFRCLYSAVEPSEAPEIPDTALLRTVRIPGALLLALGDIWADSQASMAAARKRKADARPGSMPGLPPMIGNAALPPEAREKEYPAELEVA